MMNDQSIRLDRMRFTKNTTSSRLVLLAILFDAIYFVSLYKINVEYYYNMMMGASILYNLVFMLAAFLASEGVKNYKQGYSWVLCLLGAIQIVRIFIWPVHAHATSVCKPSSAGKALGSSTHIGLNCYLRCFATVGRGGHLPPLFYPCCLFRRQQAAALRDDLLL